MLYYTGIGSRAAPERILRVTERLGAIFRDQYILRSGGAPGMDSAFEMFVPPERKEIFLPWKNFNGNRSPLYSQDPVSMEIAKFHHPAWDFLRGPVRKLMSRNVHQVLGQDLETPSEFVLCWTADGAQTQEEITRKTGGTGLAISVANENNIPVHNLGNEKVLNSLLEQYNLKEYYESI